MATDPKDTKPDTPADGKSDTKTDGRTTTGRTTRPDTTQQAATDRLSVDGIGASNAAAHEARVTVPGAPNVDARLDNRVGADRPPLESFPAKPQQIDGPDVMHQVEHTRRTLGQDAMGRALEDVGERKGMFSPGPHGLSDEALREGDTSFGTEGLTVDEAAKGAPKAG